MARFFELRPARCFPHHQIDRQDIPSLRQYKISNMSCIIFLYFANLLINIMCTYFAVSVQPRNLYFPFVDNFEICEFKPTSKGTFFEIRQCILYLRNRRNSDKKYYTVKYFMLSLSRSLLQTSKFSMASFYVTSFICSSVRATLTIFSMTSALAQKLAC